MDKGISEEEIRLAVKDNAKFTRGVNKFYGEYRKEFAKSGKKKS
jgi:hypothetical protein